MKFFRQFRTEVMSLPNWVRRLIIVIAAFPSILLAFLVVALDKALISEGPHLSVLRMLAEQPGDHKKLILDVMTTSADASSWSLILAVAIIFVVIVSNALVFTMIKWTKGPFVPAHKSVDNTTTLSAQ
ncbi:hypothetical protein [Pseudomonas aeruginosa]|uniref:hypothetical protein n=1 Tax=Pseudomonas aeruginosa TaxID=287 RepID=UPI0032B43F76